MRRVHHEHTTIRLPTKALLLAMWSCSAAAAALVPPAVELVLPAAGSAIAGGGKAIVEWSPTAGPLEQPVEEWEAFLSFNGGQDYAVRLTPHLDIELRRFSFDVPNIPTNSARILLRFGDEKQEVSVEVPYVFSIRPAAVPIAARRGLPTPQRGESARSGERGVAIWTDGSRDGGRRTLYRALPNQGFEPVVAPAQDDAPPSARRQDDRVIPAESNSRAGGVRPDPAPGASSLALPPSPIRLLACRQNE